MDVVSNDVNSSSNMPQKRKRADEDQTRSVMLNVDILACLYCCERLTAPIFQCENGHFACSCCHPKLKNKCPICTLPIGHIRCRAMEIVLDSITEGEINTKVTKHHPSVTVTDKKDGTQIKSNPTEITELSGDGETANNIQDQQHGDPEQEMWFYACPDGFTQGPFSLTQLKEWNDCDYFPDNLKVWRRGERIESAVLLVWLLRHINT